MFQFNPNSTLSEPTDQSYSESEITLKDNVSEMDRLMKAGMCSIIY